MRKSIYVVIAAYVILSSCGGKDAPKTPAVDALSDNTFKDSRDGKVYRTVKIGSQVWFAQNLDFAAEGSVCYENSPDSCKKYGRLYDWKTAKTACPAGWHLPTDKEWDVLMIAVGGVKDNDGDWEGAGKQLKSASGWNEGRNGTDAHGFSALPGGYGSLDGLFYYAGDYGYWWSATEFNANYAWYRCMFYYFEFVFRYYIIKTYLFSVRCVQDTGGQK